MTVIRCSPAINERDFSDIPAQEMPDNEEEFFLSMEVGTPHKVKLFVPGAVGQLREGLLQLSQKVKFDFVVYGIWDQWGGRQESAIVVKVEHMAHGSAIRKVVADAMRQLKHGEEVVFSRPRGNADVFFHIITGLEEFSDASGDMVGWEHADDGCHTTAERLPAEGAKRLVMGDRRTKQYRQYIKPKSRRQADYHYLAVGESCVVAYDGTAAKANNIRTVVSGYGRRNGRKFKVKRGADIVTITRTE